jgi:hypothetical protein
VDGDAPICAEYDEYGGWDHLFCGLSTPRPVSPIKLFCNFYDVPINKPNRAPVMDSKGTVMSRLTPIAAIFLSLALCACQATQSASSPAKNSTLTANAPAGGAGGASAAAASNAGAIGAAAGANSSGGSLASTATDSGRKSEFSILTIAWIAIIGYILLQVYAGGELTGKGTAATAVLGHVMTAGVFFAIRLFDNIFRFLAAEFTGTPRMPVSLFSGNPNPNAIYNSHPTGANGAAAQSMVEGLGLGLSSRGVGSMDIRSPRDTQEAEQHVAVG